MYRGTGPYHREENPTRTKTDDIPQNVVDNKFAYDQIVQAIKDWDWTRTTATAYVDQIYKTLLANRGWRFDRLQTLIPYFEKANLPIDRDLEISLAEAWSQSSFERCYAYDKIVLDTAAAEGFIDFQDSAFLLRVVERLGKDNGWTKVRAAQEAEIEQTKRARLIAGVLE